MPSSLLQKAEGEQAEAESELAKAEADLAKAQKDLHEAETLLARQQTQLITAPVAGTFTDLFGSKGTRMVKKGDVICMLRPATKTRRAESSPSPPE